jgi:putative peptidoglycan lipid II flippase
LRFWSSFADVLSALAMIFMPFLVGTVIAPKFASDPAKFDLTVLLARIMFPYLAAMSLVAMLAGILNSLRRYFLAALAPVLLNVVLVSGLIGVRVTSISPHRISASCSGLVGHPFGRAPAWPAGLGTQAREFQHRVRPPELTPAVRRLLWLALPAAVTGGITQINLLVGQIIASAQDGAIAVINYADRLNQLPLGVIGIAIGVVLLPELSRALRAGTPRKRSICKTAASNSAGDHRSRRRRPGACCPSRSSRWCSSAVPSPAKPPL